MITTISENEVNERVRLNAERLLAPYYQIGEVFSPADYDWQGDKEGRALLAFVCHASMGRENPCMKQMIAKWREKTNGDLYFGTTDHTVLSEQQLSGHNWVLRGLCEYKLLTGDPFADEALASIVRGLYLPAEGRFRNYPTGRREEGGVAGSSLNVRNGFLLSSDVGCAFMSIDGLSQVYELTKDAEVFTLLDEMISVFLSIDKEEIRAQTHCSLTAARGILRLYRVTREPRFLAGAEQIAMLYAKSGMTPTYQNLNWWGRPDSWTEPCAIVDSLLLFTGLYEETGKEEYRTLALGVAYNGFSSLQRSSGAAGTDKIVTPEQPYLRADAPEIPFCCTMRLAEGLRFLAEKRAFFDAETPGELKKDALGRITDGVILYTEYLPDVPWAKYFDTSRALPYEGKTFVPLLNYTAVPMELMPGITQKILY